jgi:hypothetical protein
VKTRARGFYNTLIAALSRVPHKADILLIIAAIAYSLPSIGYPFGRDQGLYFYMGREWLNGLLPYRDAFDHKPPGIYLIYALGMLLFGQQQWAIRVLELAAVLLTGLIIAYSVRRDRLPVNGERGALCLLTAGFYFTCFDYWDTAQIEIWEGLALIAAYAAADKINHPWLRAILAGLLVGAAFIFKFPAAFIAIIIAGVVVLRAWSSFHRLRVVFSLLSLVMYAAAAFSIILVVIIYFALRQGLPEMVDVLLGYNKYYLYNKPTSPDTAWEWTRIFWGSHCLYWLCLLLSSWGLGIILAVKRKSGSVVRGATAALALCLSAGISVWMQQKFYSYHWGVMVPFLVLCAGYGLSEGMRYNARLTGWLAVAAVMVGFIYAPPWLVNTNMNYQTMTKSFWGYAAGYVNRAVYLEPFIGGFGYNYRDNEIIGEIIRKRAQPGDQLQVRGFEPAIYAVSGLRSPSRFFAEFPLRDPALQYNRTTWSAEHAKTLMSHPPRFMVTFSHDTYDLRSLLKRGYLKIASAGRFVLLESGRWLEEE